MRTGRAVRAQVNVRRLEELLQRAAVAFDVLAQRAALLVAHDEINRFILAEGIEHAHDIRVLEAGDRPGLLDKAVHPGVEKLRRVGRYLEVASPVHAQRHRRGQVLLDGDHAAFVVLGKVDKGKSADREHALNAVALQLRAVGERLVGLRWHLPYDSSATCLFPSKA